jgi:beta-1,4-N-acetylglucosaminyltransferase
MIVVTVGTNEARFDRLLRTVQDLELEEDLIVQYGSCDVRPFPATLHQELAYQDLVDLIRAARAVVAHAGAGIVLTALANGKRPIVLPRLKRYGEAVDDHQLHFGRKLAARGLLTLIEDGDGLREALANDASCSSVAINPDPLLIDDLRSQINEAVGSLGRSGGLTVAA